VAADGLLMMILSTLYYAGLRESASKIEQIEQKAVATADIQHKKAKSEQRAKKTSEREIASRRHHEKTRHEKNLNLRTHDNRPMGKQYMGANKKGH